MRLFNILFKQIEDEKFNVLNFYHKWKIALLPSSVNYHSVSQQCGKLFIFSYLRRVGMTKEKFVII